MIEDPINSVIVLSFFVLLIVGVIWVLRSPKQGANSRLNLDKFSDKNDEKSNYIYIFYVYSCAKFKCGEF